MGRDIRSRGFSASPCHTIMSLSDSSDCCWPSKRRTACKHRGPTLPRLPASLLTLLALPTRCCSSLRPSLTQRTAPFIRVSESPANQVRASGRRQRRFGISVATSQRRYRAAQWSFDSEGIFFFQRYRIALHCIAREEVEMRINATR